MHVIAIICDSFDVTDYLGVAPSIEEVSQCVEDNVLSSKILNIVCETVLLRLSSYNMNVEDRIDIKKRIKNDKL